MGLTNFPNGISSFGVPIIGGGIVPVTMGTYFFVNSGTGSNSNAGTKEYPFATIDYAIGQCTANKGDVIVVFPGHAETIAAAGGITCDVAGITIIGLGTGSLRPTVTWSGTASTWTVSAANVTISNIITTISIDEVVSMFNVTAANCMIDRVDFQPYGAIGVTGQALQWLTAATGASYITVQNCRHYQYTAANTAQVWMNFTSVTGLKVLNNTAHIVAMASTSSHWIGSGGACLEVEIVGNRVLFLGATVTGVITLTTASTGIICDNRLASGTSVAITTAIVADAAYVFENYWIDDAAASGILTPAAGTD